MDRRLLSHLSMKKPKQALRSRSLDTSQLAKATGGRGTYHGNFTCDNCGYEFTGGSACPNCGCGVNSDTIDYWSFYGIDPYFF